MADKKNKKLDDLLDALSTSKPNRKLVAEGFKEHLNAFGTK